MGGVGREGAGRLKVFSSVSTGVCGGLEKSVPMTGGGR